MGVGVGTAAAIGAGTAIIGTGVSVAGAVQQEQAQSAAAKYQAQVASNNALVAQQNAQLARDQAEAKAVADTRAGSMQLSAARAAIAANGVDVGSGSALDVQSEIAGNTTQRAQQEQYGGTLSAFGDDVQASNYTAQAGLDNASASNAASASTLSAAGNFLAGASQVSSKWASWKQPGYDAPQSGGLY